MIGLRVARLTQLSTTKQSEGIKSNTAGRLGAILDIQRSEKVGVHSVCNILDKRLPARSDPYIV